MQLLLVSRFTQCVCGRVSVSVSVRLCLCAAELAELLGKTALAPLISCVFGVFGRVCFMCVCVCVCLYVLCVAELEQKWQKWQVPQNWQNRQNWQHW